MRVLITGGTGTVGQRLADDLMDHGHEVAVLSRRPIKPLSLPVKITFLQWDGKTAKGWGQHLDEVDAVVHLAGAGVADKRWTEERKKLILSSRVDSGHAVLEAIENATNKPKVLIQASAVGYYGTSEEKTFTEADGPGSDFLADVCVKWEAATAPVEAMGVRRAVIRTGVVLDPEGGALPKMAMPFRFFVGGPLGNGRQWVPWIHYQDEIAAIRFLIETETASGPFNLTAPNPVRNRELAKALGYVMSRPAIAPAPGFAIELVVGEMANAVLEGQRVLPERLQQLGFQFKYPHIEPALQDLLG